MPVQYAGARWRWRHGHVAIAVAIAMLHVACWQLAVSRKARSRPVSIGIGIARPPRDRSLLVSAA
jgi:hypothetical protein